jgi:hypothetical protein
MRKGSERRRNERARERTTNNEIRNTSGQRQKTPVLKAEIEE